MATETPKKSGAKTDPKAAAIITSPNEDSPARRANEAAKTKEETAAEKIQAFARGAQVRAQEKDKRLWNAWNELDWKEESELMESHSHYETMKNTLEKKRNEEKKADAGGAAETFSIPVPKKEAATASPVALSRELPKPDEKKGVLDNDDGLTLSDPIQLDFVTAMMDHFKANKVLDLENVLEILKRAKPLLAKLPNVVVVTVNTRITVVGDLHGQLDDLLAIFKLNGLPSPRNSYVFNGDFVDRGQYSCECILILLAFKLLYPKFLHLNRGNHEARDINSRDGFEKECIQKYNTQVFDMFSDLFAALPLATLLEGDKKVFVVHGGLFWDDLTIPQINEIKRFHEIPPTGSHMEQMLWSDPDPEHGRQDSPRGASLLFGPDVTEKFMADNGVSLIIRSHECMQQGFEKMHNDTLITVFSASNYCKSVGNDGAFVIFEKDMTPKIVTFYAKPKERLSRYRMRHALLENDIISKLLQRISDNRLGLVNHYRSVETKVGGIGTVTRQQWAEGLKKVLKLNIPFLEFQDYLGLPKLGVDGKKKGAIDHMAFLLRFKPVNTLLARSVWREDGDGKTREVLKSLESINEVLYRNRYELESLFRHFDTNGDDRISMKEFKEGVLSLQGMLENKFSESEVDALVKHVDINSDGYISYSEFFASFQLVDPKLAERQAAGKRTREGAPAPSAPVASTSHSSSSSSPATSAPSSPSSSSSAAASPSSPASPATPTPVSPATGASAAVAAKKEEKKAAVKDTTNDTDEEDDDEEREEKPSLTAAKKRTTTSGSNSKNGAGKKKGAKRT